MKTFRGRINRSWYWLALGLLAVIYLALNLAAYKQVPVSEVALIFLCVPRLHDIGKSGWFVLIGIGTELLGIAIGFAFFSLGGILGSAALVIVGLLVWLGAIPGDPNPNAWGEPPLPGLQWRRQNRASAG